MSHTIKKTKRQLSLTFTIIVFIVILLFGFIFFSTKYVRSLSIEKKDFSHTIDIIEKRQLTISQLSNIQKQIRRRFLQEKGLPPKVERDLLGKGRLNFIVTNGDGNITSHNVKVELEDHFIKQLLGNKKHTKHIHFTNGFFIKKIQLKNNHSLIIFQKIHYEIGDYLGDLFLFLILSLCLSSLIYIIGNRFVHRAFIPVEENLEEMKNFVHNAGHELKTPISVIDSNLQLIDDIKSYDKEMTKEMKQEIQKLNSLINSLIQLTDINSLQKKEKNNLKEVTEEILKDFQQKIDKKNIEVSLKIENNIHIMAHKGYLYIFLSNIIGNAIKYNKEGGNIKITYENSLLTVKDTGTGMKVEEIDQIWKRFYQIDNSRSKEGFGIGLSLVKKIADIYKWKVTVNSTIGKGSTFSIKF